MSENIPLELQVEIIKRVPVKSLLRFRSVSKEWKSVIDSSKFADDYCLRHSQHRLLIRYIPYDTFHQHQIPTTKSVIDFRDSRIVGCSHGLFCLYAYDLCHSVMAVLWNPWIRKFVDIPVPNVRFKPYQIILGFGVNPQTRDPKIVKINSFYRPRVETSFGIPWRVEVFTLSSGTWKTPSCSGNNIPTRNTIIFDWDQVVLDGVIYWLAFEWIKVDTGFRHHNLIMSFDLISEGFEEVCLPDNLALLNNLMITISKRMESVVVLEMDENATSCGVWMMGQDVTKSFTKLFTLMTRVPPFFIIRGFMNNGEPIVDHGSNALFAYDSYSERIKDLGIVGVVHNVRFSVKSYMETLLLINQ